jgi:hypothetical protein
VFFEKGSSMTLPHIFITSLKDALAPNVLWVTLFSFVATILFFVFTIWAIFGGLESLTLFVEAWVQGFENGLEQNWLLKFLSFVVIAKTLIMILFFLSSAMVVYYLFLMVYSIIVGFFAGFFIKEIARHYYPQVSFKGMALTRYVWLLLKAICVTALLFLLFSPLLFIPFLNVMLLIPVFYLFHKLLVLEVASVVHSYEEYQKIQKSYGGHSRALSALCFALTLIPVIGVVIYPYYVIVVSHFLLGKTQSLREEA